MAISKVVYDGSTLIDLTSDSVNASNLSKGTTAHNAAGEQIVGTFEQAQSDWNQNDETAVDYVKNRPFYTKNPVETVLVEERTLSFTEADPGAGVYTSDFEGAYSFIAGKTYTVYWDGNAYELAWKIVEGETLCLGNLSIAFGGTDTGEPFFVMTDNSRMMVYTVDASASHTFSISKVLQEIVKIDTKYLPFMPKPDGESYLTFKSQNSFKIGAHENTKSWNGTLEYFSSDNTWTVWDGTSYLSAVTNGAEYVLYLRGTGNTVITGGQNPFKFLGSDIACIGNIENLLDYAAVEAGEHPTMATNCYAYMFANCASLIQAPELPATTLTQSCYGYMFYDCTGLKQAPELPATTLADYCYTYMFGYCSSLTQAPELPATTLAYYCYGHMFAFCSSLKQAPELPATTLAGRCYYAMFSNCTGLIQASKLHATTLADECCSNMFSECTSLIQAPELSVITLSRKCYDHMFYGCTSLKLSETKTEEYIQEYRIPSSGDGTTSSDALTRMFASTGGTFTGTPQINTTYYLSSDNMIARGTEISTLNGYVKNMIDTTVEIPETLPNPNAITFTGAMTGSYDGSAPLSVNIPIVPTKTSQLTNDSGFLTSHQDISGKQDKSTLEADVAAKGFTKNTGTYSKPAGGIPKADLAAEVQTSLGKADTALQKHQSLAAYRTAAAQDAIDNGKVDKVTDKGLSSNDYTAAAKAKVDAIPANPKYTDTVYDDTALKERVATIEGKESAWDAKSDFSGSYNDLTDKPTISTIPEYVRTEAETVARIVNQHQSSDSIVFPFLSDAHCGYYTDTGNAAATLAGQLLNQISKRTPYDFIVHGGDFSTGAWNTTKLDSFEHIEDYTELMSEANKGVLSLWCAGNHDDAAYQATAGRVSQKELFGLVGRKNRINGASCPNGCNYGYLDLENRKLRVIYLDTDDKRNWGTVLISSSSSVPEYLNAQNVGGDQLRWLANTGLDFTDKANPAEWSIVVVSHAALNINGTTTDAVSGTVYAHNTENAAKIINAYRTGKSGSITHNGVTINYNFTTVESKATVICAVHGHNHKFSSETLTGGILSIGCPNVMNGRERASDDGNTYTKTAGTANGTSFCILTIDRENHKIYADCVGVGYDREFAYTTEVIAYTNQIPISIDTDGSIYGYKAGYRLNSGGASEAMSGSYLTGFIPIAVGDTVYMKNVTFKYGANSGLTSANQRVSFYNASKTHVVQINAAGLAGNANGVKGDDNIWTQFTLKSTVNNINCSGVAYFRINAAYIGDDSIITVNEPIG